MKHLNKTLIIPVVAVALISCMSAPMKSDAPVIDRSYLKMFDACEEISRWYESDEDMHKILGDGRADSVILAWNHLKDICYQDRLQEAKELLTSKEYEGKLILFLRNTTAQYFFFGDLKYPALLQVDSALARKELVDDFRFCLAMTEIVIEMGDQDELNVPPHYANLVFDYFQFLLDDGDYDRAEPLTDRLYKYSILGGMEEKEATYHKMTMEAMYAAKTSKRDDALKKINELHDFMMNDPDSADSADIVTGYILNSLINR